MSAEQGDVEALEWLARSRDSKSPSVAKVHATTLLTRFDRLVAALERAERERDYAIQGHATWSDRDNWKARAEKAERALAEIITAADELLLWQPGKKGYAEAHKRFYVVIAALRPFEDTSDES